MYAGIAQHCFTPKETWLHKLSFSWQVIANLLDFCVLRLPWPPRMWALAYRRMPVSYSYWTSGGCQSEGPRGLRPLGPTDWHPPSVQIGDSYSLYRADYDTQGKAYRRVANSKMIFLQKVTVHKHQKFPSQAIFKKPGCGSKQEVEKLRTLR